MVDSECLELRWVVLSRFRPSVCMRLFASVILLCVVFIFSECVFYVVFGSFASVFLRFFLEVVGLFYVVLCSFW